MNLENRFIEEYNKHADAIFRFCFFKLSDREEAKDLTQEVFTRTWNYLANGGEIKNTKAFLFRSARNLVIDKYRKKKEDSLDRMIEAGFDPGYDETEKNQDIFDGAKVIELLNKLPEETQEIVSMRYIEEMSIQEIAEVTGHNPGAISVRIHRAIAKLKLIYKEVQL